MNEVGGGPTVRFVTLQFVERLAEIFHALLTDEFDFAFRRRCIDEPGNAIDDQTKALFARTRASFVCCDTSKVQRIIHRHRHLVGNER